jgi:putative transposase
MGDWRSLAHVKWECKYHIVRVPKYRRKVLYGRVRRTFGAIIKELRRQRGIELVDGHAMVEHVHLCFPPKYNIANVVDFFKRRARYDRIVSSSGVE